MNAALVFGVTAVVQTSRGRKTECIHSAYVAMALRKGPAAAESRLQPTGIHLNRIRALAEVSRVFVVVYWTDDFHCELSVSLRSQDRRSKTDVTRGLQGRNSALRPSG
jgi:hypothetical protein